MQMSTNQCSTINKPSGYLISDIFNEAGQAFIKMGSLTTSLKDNSNSNVNTKWTQSEIDRFYNAIKKFSSELNSICTSLDNKIKEEIHNSVERNVLTESGFNISEINTLWRSEEAVDKNRKDVKSEDHSPDYIDQDDETRDTYNSEDDNYDLE